MAKSHIVKPEKRVVFPKGRQKKFLTNILKTSGLTSKEFAETFSVNTRTLNYWLNEKSTIPLPLFKAVCKKFKIDKPPKIEVREAFWSTKKAALLGGEATYKKYGRVGGDEERRKKRWRTWYEKEGKDNLPKPFRAQTICKPRKSIALAEFVGIILGDGGITSAQVTVSLHNREIAYKDFVCVLIEKLFLVKPKVYERVSSSVFIITISSVELVAFCELIGLAKGNKVRRQVDIPDWIKKSRQFSRACLRGLIDTDGSVYNECHHIRGKRYCYPRLAFTNASKPLLCSTAQILEGLAFSPKIRNNVRVQIEDIKEIRRYFKVVGPHNPKHTARFRSFGGVG